MTFYHCCTEFSECAAGSSTNSLPLFLSLSVSVRGVGNVCSFAQMDVRKHGNPDWQIDTSGMAQSPPQNYQQQQRQKQQQQQAMAGGKTEMSLVRFTLNNPEWQMPKEATLFMKGLREHAMEELVRAKTAQPAFERDNLLTHSLISFGTIGEEYGSIAQSVLAADLTPEQVLLSQSISASRHAATAAAGGAGGAAGLAAGAASFRVGEPALGTLSFRHMSRSSSVGPPADKMRRLRLSKAEGRIEGPTDTLLYSLYGVEPRLASDPVGVTVADMCLSALYLHELSQQKRQARQSRIDEAEAEDDLPGPSNRPRPPQPPSAGQGQGPSGSRQTVITSKSAAAERTPLLGNVRS